MEAAATQYFAAADRIEQAQREAGAAIQSLIDEGESRSEISALLGITAREIRAALATISSPESDDGDEAHRENDGAPADANSDTAGTDAGGVGGQWR